MLVALSFIGLFFTTILFFFSRSIIFLFFTPILFAFAHITNVIVALFLFFIFISFNSLIEFFFSITNALFSNSTILLLSRIITFDFFIILPFATIILLVFVSITIAVFAFIQPFFSYHSLIFAAAPLSQPNFFIMLICAHIIHIPSALSPPFLCVLFESFIFIFFPSLFIRFIFLLFPLVIFLHYLIFLFFEPTPFSEPTLFFGSKFLSVLAFISLQSIFAIFHFLICPFFSFRLIIFAFFIAV